ncbi:MAG: ribonuclease H-like domain-containing protein [Bacillota bacterium]|nr:ribonuclease H-like domain-containing protein [Bacillota bacterium]
MPDDADGVDGVDDVDDVDGVADALAAKLAQLRRLVEAAEKRAGRPPVPQPPPPQQQAESWPIESAVHGTVLDTARGSCFLSDSVLPSSHRHGRWPLALALELRGDELDWLSFPTGAGCACLDRAVFVDVETTGLAGGTGTIPFLIGLGFFEGPAFVIHQYLMRGPHEEAAVLAEVSARASERETVVSFNGKAFDLPLLETRYTLARQRFPFPTGHVDLLFGARRVWRPRLESCRLANLEYRVLGVSRHDDIPGSLVPQVYQDYLRTGDGRYLAPVFEHNLLDVLSLVTLAGRLGQLRRRPLSALEDDPADLVALGRSLERAARAAGCADRPEAQNESMQCYREALAAGLAADDAARALLALSLLHKRRGERDEALRCWEQLARGPGRAGPACARPALIELAKHHEHVTRDYALALGYSEAAARLPGGPAEKDALSHRIRRLSSRLRGPAA